MNTGSSGDINKNKPFIKAALKAFNQQLAKDKLLEQVVDDATSHGDITLATQIGLFVVYVQQLEETLKRIITITFSFSSHFSNNGYSFLYNSDAIISDRDSLGTLIKLLKNIDIRDEKTHEQVLDGFVKKLELFVQKRNNYIHKLLNDPTIIDLDSFSKTLIKANLELLQLVRDADDIMVKINTLFGLDGLPYTFARHIISSEKYKPKPKI